MSKNKQSKNNKTIKGRLEAMGMRVTPKDHPIYTMKHASIRFVSKNKWVQKRERDNEK